MVFLVSKLSIKGYIRSNNCGTAANCCALHWEGLRCESCRLPHTHTRGGQRRRVTKTRATVASPGHVEADLLPQSIGPGGGAGADEQRGGVDAAAELCRRQAQAARQIMLQDVRSAPRPSGVGHVRYPNGTRYCQRPPLFSFWRSARFLSLRCRHALLLGLMVGAPRHPCAVTLRCMQLLLSTICVLLLLHAIMPHVVSPPRWAVPV